MASSDEDKCPPVAVPLQVASARIIEETSPTIVDEQPGAPPPVPVLLLTGYLGAGKTTLVNHILTAKHGYRCAVLLNEIGDTADVEKALVKEPEGTEASPLADWVQLENGCICCSVKSDMVKALESLLQQRERFDYIIIETTGLANPGPVATALWTDAEIESSVCLDAIVTVVDAKNINRHLHEAREGGGVNEAQQQVAFADVILLNKIDLVEAREVEQVERDIAAINAEVDIVRCERCAVDLGGILHTGMYSSSAPKVPELDPNASLLSAENSNGGASGVGDNAGVEMHGEDVNGHDAHEHCGPGCSHPLHANGHDPSVRTVTLRVNRPLCMRRLRHWLDELLWEGQTAVEGTGNDASAGAASALLPEVFRMKGLLHVRASDRKWVLQGVHELYDVVEGPEWPEEQVHSDRGSKVVFIGRHLDGPKLQQGLQACCVDEI